MLYFLLKIIICGAFIILAIMGVLAILGIVLQSFQFEHEQKRKREENIEYAMKEWGWSRDYAEKWFEE